MRKLLCLFMILLCASCKKGNQPTSGYDTSLQAWSAYKASVHNSYSYISYRFDGRGFVPQYWQSKVTVQNGVVVARAYEVRYLNETGQLLGSYTEDRTTLNTHEGDAPALTLDEIYVKANTEWLTVDKTKNTVYFEVDSRGLISRCGYAPNDCAECFTGVYLKGIQ